MSNAKEITTNHYYELLVSLLDEADKQAEKISEETGQSKTDVYASVMALNCENPEETRKKISGQIYAQVEVLKVKGISQQEAAQRIGIRSSEISSAKSADSYRAFSIPKLISILENLKKL